MKLKILKKENNYFIEYYNANINNYVKNEYIGNNNLIMYNKISDNSQNVYNDNIEYDFDINDW